MPGGSDSQEIAGLQQVYTVRRRSQGVDAKSGNNTCTGKVLAVQACQPKATEASVTQQRLTQKSRDRASAEQSRERRTTRASSQSKQEVSNTDTGSKGCRRSKGAARGTRKPTVPRAVQKPKQSCLAGPPSKQVRNSKRNKVSKTNINCSPSKARQRAASAAAEKKGLLLEYEADGELFRVGGDAYVITDDRLDVNSLWFEADAVCQICSSARARGHGAVEMLECDRCMQGFHRTCLSPPLSEVPKGRWFCPSCEAGEPLSTKGQQPTAWRTVLEKQGLDLARIEAMWWENDTVRARLRWYMLPEDTHAGRKAHHANREVFLTDSMDDVDIDSLLRVATVCATEAEFEATVGDDVFLCEYKYDADYRVFRRRDRFEEDHEWAAELEQDVDADPVDDETRDITFKPIYQLWLERGLIAPPNISSKPAPVSLKKPRKPRKKQGIDNKGGRVVTLHDLLSDEVKRQQCKQQKAQGTAARLAAAQQLLTSRTPDDLPCREKEVKEVCTFVRDAVTAGEQCSGRYLYLSGVPGTGKTATVHQVMRNLQQEVRKGELQAFRFVEVNGLKLPSPQHVYSALYEALTGEMLSSNAALQRLNDMFDKPVEGDQPVTVLLIDEMDLLVTKKQEVLYNLFEWPNQKSSRLAVIGIANTMDLPERLLPRIVSRLGNARLQFQPYHMEQLKTIVLSRVRDFADVLPEAVLQFAARKVATVAGDVRRCLEMLRSACHKALIEHNSGKSVSCVTVMLKYAHRHILSRISEHLQMPHMEQAYKEMFSSVHMDMLRNCSLVGKCLLASIHLESKITGHQQVAFLPVYNRLSTILSSNGLSTVVEGVAVAVAAELGSMRLILADPPARRLRMRMMLNMRTEELLAVLKEDAALASLKNLNF